MRLEIQHITAYAPYELKVFDKISESKKTVIGVEIYSEMILLHNGFSFTYRGTEDIAPILKRLTLYDLEEMFPDFCVNPEEFITHEMNIDFPTYSLDDISYQQAQELLKEKYDIFNLIDNEIAFQNG